MSSFLGHLVDMPCRRFVDLKSNKSGTKSIEFLNQSYLVLLNGKMLGDTSSYVTLAVDKVVVALYIGTCIVRYNTLTQFAFQTTFQSKCLRS